MKKLFKRSTYYLFCIVVSPLILATILLSRTPIHRQVFQGSSQLLSLVPFKVGVYIRTAYFSCCCKNVQRDVTVEFLTLLSHIDTRLGHHVYIGAQCNIGFCSIGDDCLLGSGVHILSGKGQHNFDDETIPIRNQGGTLMQVHIGNNCWIGNNATVMANIGSNSIVAAGSVVVHDMPERCIVGGNPARIIRTR